VSQTLELVLETTHPAEAVRACLAWDPDVKSSESGNLYAVGLHAIQVTDVSQPTSDDDSHRRQFGFKPTVHVWAQLQRDTEPDEDGGLPGVNTFLAIAGRLLRATPGDAVMVQNDYVVFLYRRAGVVTLQADWATERNRACLAVEHRTAVFPDDGGPAAVAVADSWR